MTTKKQSTAKTVCDIYLFSEINYQVAQDVISKINLANQKSTEYSKIVITSCSPGGHFYPSFAIYDAVRLSKLPVEFIGSGWVASCAVMIMQACTRRSITKNTYIMIHPSINSLTTKSHQEFMAISQQYDKEHLRFIELSAEGTSLSVSDFERITKQEMRIYYTPEEALKLNLIDEIL